MKTGTYKIQQQATPAAGVQYAAEMQLIFPKDAGEEPSQHPPSSSQVFRLSSIDSENLLHPKLCFPNSSTLRSKDVGKILLESNNSGKSPQMTAVGRGMSLIEQKKLRTMKRNGLISLKSNGSLSDTPRNTVNQSFTRSFPSHLETTVEGSSVLNAFGSNIAAGLSHFHGIKSSASGTLGEALWQRIKRKSEPDLCFPNMNIKGTYSHADLHGCSSEGITRKFGELSDDSEILYRSDTSVRQQYLKKNVLGSSSKERPISNPHVLQYLENFHRQQQEKLKGDEAFLKINENSQGEYNWGAPTPTSSSTFPDMHCFENFGPTRRNQELNDYHQIDNNNTDDGSNTNTLVHSKSKQIGSYDNACHGRHCKSINVCDTLSCLSASSGYSSSSSSSNCGSLRSNSTSSLHGKMDLHSQMKIYDKCKDRCESSSRIDSEVSAGSFDSSYSKPGLDSVDLTHQVINNPPTDSTRHQPSSSTSDINQYQHFSNCVHPGLLDTSNYSASRHHHASTDPFHSEKRFEKTNFLTFSDRDHPAELNPTSSPGYFFMRKSGLQSPPSSPDSHLTCKNSSMKINGRSTIGKFSGIDPLFFDEELEDQNSVLIPPLEEGRVSIEQILFQEKRFESNNSDFQSPFYQQELQKFDMNKNTDLACHSGSTIPCAIKQMRAIEEAPSKQVNSAVNPLIAGRSFNFPTQMAPKNDSINISLVGTGPPGCGPGTGPQINITLPVEMFYDRTRLTEAAVQSFLAQSDNCGEQKICERGVPQRELMPLSNRDNLDFLISSSNIQNEPNPLQVTHQGHLDTFNVDSVTNDSRSATLGAKNNSKTYQDAINKNLYRSVNERDLFPAEVGVTDDLTLVRDLDPAACQRFFSTRLSRTKLMRNGEANTNSHVRDMDHASPIESKNSCNKLAMDKIGAGIFNSTASNNTGQDRRTCSKQDRSCHEMRTDRVEFSTVSCNDTNAKNDDICDKCDNVMRCDALASGYRGCRECGVSNGTLATQKNCGLDLASCGQNSKSSHAKTSCANNCPPNRHVETHNNDNPYTQICEPTSARTDGSHTNTKISVESARSTEGSTASSETVTGRSECWSRRRAVRFELPSVLDFGNNRGGRSDRRKLLAEMDESTDALTDKMLVLKKEMTELVAVDSDLYNQLAGIQVRIRSMAEQLKALASIVDDEKDTIVDDEKETTMDEEKETIVDDEKDKAVDDEKDTTVDDEKETTMDEEKETIVDDSKLHAEYEAVDDKPSYAMDEGKVGTWSDKNGREKQDGDHRTLDYVMKLNGQNTKNEALVDEKCKLKEDGSDESDIDVRNSAAFVAAQTMNENQHTLDLKRDLNNNGSKIGSPLLIGGYDNKNCHLINTQLNSSNGNPYSILPSTMVSKCNLDKDRDVFYDEEAFVKSSDPTKAQKCAPNFAAVGEQFSKSQPTQRDLNEGIHHQSTGTAKLKDQLVPKSENPRTPTAVTKVDIQQPSKSPYYALDINVNTSRSWTDSLSSCEGDLYSDADIDEVVDRDSLDGDQAIEPVDQDSLNASVADDSKDLPHGWGVPNGPAAPGTSGAVGGSSGAVGGSSVTVSGSSVAVGGSSGAVSGSSVTVSGSSVAVDGSSGAVSGSLVVISGSSGAVDNYMGAVGDFSPSKMDSAHARSELAMTEFSSVIPKVDIPNIDFSTLKPESMTCGAEDLGSSITREGEHGMASADDIILSPPDAFASPPSLPPMPPPSPTPSLPPPPLPTSPPPCLDRVSDDKIIEILSVSGNVMAFSSGEETPDNEGNFDCLVQETRDVSPVNIESEVSAAGISSCQMKVNGNITQINFSSKNSTAQRKNPHTKTNQFRDSAVTRLPNPSSASKLPSALDPNHQTSKLSCQVPSDTCTMTLIPKPQNIYNVKKPLPKKDNSHATSKPKVHFDPNTESDSKKQVSRSLSLPQQGLYVNKYFDGEKSEKLGNTSEKRLKPCAESKIPKLSVSRESLLHTSDLEKPTKNNLHQGKTKHSPENAIRNETLTKSSTECTTVVSPILVDTIPHLDRSPNSVIESVGKNPFNLNNSPRICGTRKLVSYDYQNECYEPASDFDASFEPDSLMITHDVTSAVSSTPCHPNNAENEGRADTNIVLSSQVILNDEGMVFSEAENQDLMRGERTQAPFSPSNISVFSRTRKTYAPCGRNRSRSSMKSVLSADRDGDGEETTVLQQHHQGSEASLMPRTEPEGSEDTGPSPGTGPVSSKTLSYLTTSSGEDRERRNVPLEDDKDITRDLRIKLMRIRATLAENKLTLDDFASESLRLKFSSLDRLASSLMEATLRHPQLRYEEDEDFSDDESAAIEAVNEALLKALNKAPKSVHFAPEIVPTEGSITKFSPTSLPGNSRSTRLSVVPERLSTHDVSSLVDESVPGLPSVKTAPLPATRKELFSNEVLRGSEKGNMNHDTSSNSKDKRHFLEPRSQNSKGHFHENSIKPSYPMAPGNQFANSKISQPSKALLSSGMSSVPEAHRPSSARSPTLPGAKYNGVAESDKRTLAPSGAMCYSSQNFSDTWEAMSADAKANHGSKVHMAGKIIASIGKRGGKPKKGMENETDHKIVVSAHTNYREALIM
ncbi:uncharacterized protein LOC108675743 [Hyalella azteca]|uniref:Uncharacterized protein LOC108675743 n=1 Tax=Hyalella azteca TaxID=294128 RepID=A0A8B7NZX5_HYAAZ|nr:uncharacterized protein LOC108675743 [Hyalella azteca]